ncbi:allophanate hydrolase [Luteolibacter sp. SL250]|uniref:allophanate hydrolase n=1 Tax=Luteolibacter sp. SL250 TaxID=2995170 RepID=UPI00226ECFE0|nr:allophanate hydrolase [Luteolibacter sp. SL250]WAC20498.1 allophanate hydrolase [Luteolibacter sp. SL250]
MLTIPSLKQSYADGTLTPTGMVSLLRKRIEAHNDPAIFIHLPPEEEWLDLAAAVESMPADLPLWGVPFVVKDNIDVAGWPTTAGCAEFSYTPAEDAEVVRLLRAAGAIPLGKANLDQFATGLVGVRSPYGIPRNVFDAAYLPGGSSSGSAAALAAGLCAFSLGTDTAGSGRVPAAFQNLIGWKPTRGLVSNRGMVPACRSLDCVSVFANTPEDAAIISEIIGVFDPADPFSRDVEPVSLETEGFLFGVPASLDFAGDPDTPALYAEAVAKLEEMGGTAVEVDLTPFVDAAKLLYEGPWVAERWAAVGDFVEAHPDAIHPVTKQILENSRGWDAAATFKAQYQLREFARDAEGIWQGVDFLLLPTTPCLYTVEEVLADPIRTNSVLGRYTNFMNLLDLAAVAVPTGFARDGRLPWGVTLAAPAGTDEDLLRLAGKFTNQPLPETLTEEEIRIPVVVCGAHLEGLALHHQLADRGAVFVQRTETSPHYRLFAMPAGGSIPARPAMVHDAENGAAIKVEVWSLDPAAFGDFVSKIPAPLGIGKVTLASGESLPGFIAEPRALDGAEEITHLRGWRAYLAR